MRFDAATSKLWSLGDYTDPDVGGAQAMVDSKTKGDKRQYIYIYMYTSAKVTRQRKKSKCILVSRIGNGMEDQ